jgi:hypothetical protein
MNRTYASALAFAVAALAAGQVFADDSAPKTREQVKAELTAALRTGNYVPANESGLKANELFPGQYPAQPVAQALTREQVQAELAEARRSGDYVVVGETGLKANELFPGQYPSKPVVQSRSRAEVQQEAQQAVRAGAPQLDHGAG